MARDALGDAAEDLVRQGSAEHSNLIRADAIATALPDEHRHISGRHTVDVGDVDADLIHAHDPDDRGAMAAIPQMPAVGQRPRQTLSVAERCGGDPACFWRSPRPPVADALALRNGPHLRDTAEHV